MITVPDFFEVCSDVPDRDMLTFMSFNIIMERISNLPRDDKDDLFELFNTWHTTEDEEEVKSIRVAMQEILTQSPMTLFDHSIEKDKPLSGKRQKWAEYAGKTIRDLRDRAGLTQVQLSERAGMPQSHLSRIETGEHSPNNLTITKLAKALGVDPKEIDPCL